MQAFRKYPLLILFTVFLLVTAVADMFISRREFSEMENRYLAQRPEFSLSQLFLNEYTPKYEKYVNDQFVGRDQWITLKSVSESAMGKIENNGVVYGRGHYMFENYQTADNRRIQMNIGFLNQFFDQYKDETRITVAVIPNSYQILTDYLPRGLQNIDQKAYVLDSYSRMSKTAKKLDLISAMENAVNDAKKNNPNSFSGTEDLVYYRTDHHWTTLGSYNAYRAFAQSLGLKAVELTDLEQIRHEQPDFYGSYYSKCKLFSAVPDKIDYYDIPFTSFTIDGMEKSTLYDESKWSGRDKHAAFLWGNNGVSIIKSNNNLNHVDGKTTRVMLIKDSYGNSFAPFLTYSYDEVYVIDARSLTGKMSELMSQTDFDDVLVMYNFMNFSSDTNIARLTY
ncbi:DHHW family protein [Oscillospiraceae bacterium PP1C4]